MNSETYTWKSKHGFDVVIAEPVTPEPDSDSVAVRWQVITLLTGEIYPAYDLGQATTLGHLLAQHYTEYAREHTVQYDPSVWIRNGVITQGRFAGLPVEYRDGVAGVCLWEQWHDAGIPA